MYVDCGHPEYCTPECVHPFEMVQVLEYGNHILSTMAKTGMVPKGGVILRNNYDPGSRQTWGCHESYNAKSNSDVRLYTKTMLIQMATRIIYSGSGGLAPYGQFFISPRFSIKGDRFRWREVYEDRLSYFDRSCTYKDGRGYSRDRRLHVYASDTLCSHMSIYLRTGATALALLLAENDIDPFDGCRMTPSLNCSDVNFNRDFHLKRTVAKSKTGKRLTMVGVQMHLLGAIEKHLKKSWMPGWAEEFLPILSMVMQRLSKDAPDSVATMLDWAIKLKMAERTLQKYPKRGDKQGKKAIAGLYQGKDPGSKDLYQLDFRYGQLPDPSVFSELDKAGVLEHRVPGYPEVKPDQPISPKTARGKLRATTLKRAKRASLNETVRVGWDRMRCGNLQCYAKSPFAAKWIPTAASNTPEAKRRDAKIRKALGTLIGEPKAKPVKKKVTKKKATKKKAVKKKRTARPRQATIRARVVSEDVIDLSF